jgi:hypothetical protein
MLRAHVRVTPREDVAAGRRASGPQRPWRPPVAPPFLAPATAADFGLAEELSPAVRFRFISFLHHLLKGAAPPASSHAHARPHPACMTPCLHARLRPAICPPPPPPLALNPVLPSRSLRLRVVRRDPLALRRRRDGGGAPPALDVAPSGLPLAHRAACRHGGLCSRALRRAQRRGHRPRRGAHLCWQICAVLALLCETTQSLAEATRAST